jgi:hypothetical protein
MVKRSRPSAMSSVQRPHQPLGQAEGDQPLAGIEEEGSAEASVQPYAPGLAPTSSLRVTTGPPSPQPVRSQNPSPKGERALCSGVIWSVIISAMPARERSSSARP